MKFCLVFLGCLSMSGVSHAGLAAPASSDLELLIFHNNDVHARFEQTSRVSSICSAADTAANKCYGGFARVANIVRKARKDAENGNGPSVLYLNAGDTYTGTIWFSVYKWRIAADFINILKPDAVSLGNHELDDGVIGLTPFIRNLTCPVLAANLELEDEPDFNGIPNLQNSIVLDIKNTKVGIIGYLTPETKFLVSPNKVKYVDEVVSIQQEVNKLKSQGVNILIALGHSGYETDKRIAKEVQGIDLVIGGHTNTFLWNGQSPDIEKAVGPYPTIVQQSSGKKVPVVQAYAYTKYLGKLLIKFDSNGEVTSYNGQPILLDNSIPREQDVMDLLDFYRPGILKYSSVVLGRTSVLLDAEPCRIEECNIGNFIADSMVYAYAMMRNSTENGWTDAPIALMHSGGIRSSIDASTSDGNVTRADVLNVLPFDNAIVSINMTGTLLKRVLEHSVYGYNRISRPGTLLQLSGLQVEYNLTRPPGSRLMSAQVLCGECVVPTYSILREDNYYKVLVEQFIFFGGDNYTMFNESHSSEILTLNDAIILGEFVTKKSPIHPEIQGRIKLYEKSGAGQLAAVAALYVLTTMCLIL